MKNPLQKIKKTLKNPLVIISLLLGILGAPCLWYSGIFITMGREFLGRFFYILWVVAYTLDAIVTLTAILNKDEQDT